MQSVPNTLSCLFFSLILRSWIDRRHKMPIEREVKCGISTCLVAVPEFSSKVGGTQSMTSIAPRGTKESGRRPLLVLPLSVRTRVSDRFTQKSSSTTLHQGPFILPQAFLTGERQHRDPYFISISPPGCSIPGHSQPDSPVCPFRKDLRVWDFWSEVRPQPETQKSARR